MKRTERRVPPGWYPSPAGEPQQWYWNGADWTKDRLPMPDMYQRQMLEAQHRTARNTQNIMTWLLVGGITAALAIFVVIMIANTK